MPIMPIIRVTVLLTVSLATSTAVSYLALKAAERLNDRIEARRLERWLRRKGAVVIED